jgi:hypothetical protein
MTVYTFQEQKQKGEIGERVLDGYITRCYHLVPANRFQQKCGIDRILYLKDNGRPIYLEYKTDWKADTTGNAFIETVSADAARKARGWSTTSKADILIYYLPPSGRIYITPMMRLRDRLEDWIAHHRSRTAPNEKYCTHGLLVPLSELASISELAKIPPRNL